MKICLVLEGSYPYVKGGVSNWVHDFIQRNPKDEFILWTITDVERKKNKFMYELPKNVVSMEEHFLETGLRMRVKKEANPHFSKQEKALIQELIRCGDPDWRALLDIFHIQGRNPIEFLMSEDFLDILKDFARSDFPYTGFSDLFWTIRSMFLPLFYLIGQPFPKADLYHSVSTGYAGVIASFASLYHHKPLVLTEHGIYTREREEEIIRSDWTPAQFKKLWVKMFYMYSRFAYQTASEITSLFHRASLIQHELGADPAKTSVISNGIDILKFSGIPEKTQNSHLRIGAIVRIAPIKDVKTLLYTFARFKQEIPNASLHILGGVDDENYYAECKELVEFLGVQDVHFEGVVKIERFIETLDFTVLTSISEGQPFAILESLAARRPVIATNVGCCKDLIEGDDQDLLGDAGICVPPMHQSALLHAMLQLARDEKRRQEMGNVGAERVRTYYDQELMLTKYNDVYTKAVSSWQG